MTSFLEYAKQYEINANDPVTLFLTAMATQKKAFSEGKENVRSWVKNDKLGYRVTLGKLGKSYILPSKEEVVPFLDLAAKSAREDDELIALIVAAYSPAPATTEAPKKRGRKAKAS